MKKLMCAVAAMAAGVAMAEGIASANVVGYQTMAYPKNGGYTAAVSTFAKADGSKITLKDLKVVGGNYTQNLIQFLSNNGTTAKFSYTDAQMADLDDYYGKGKKKKENGATLFYINEEDAVDMECTAGWYAQVDGDCIVNLSESTDFDVSFGRGYYYNPVIDEAQLQYNGEVVKGDSTLDIPVTGGYTLTGNCSPTDFDLGYFSVDGGNYTQNWLQFLNNDGTTAKFTYTDDQLADLDDYYGKGKKKKENGATFFYINADDAVDMECTPGWYAQVDGDCIVNLSTSFTVKSGYGFYFNPVNTDVKLVIPSAIEE